MVYSATGKENSSANYLLDPYEVKEPNAFMLGYITLMDLMILLIY